MTINRQWLLQRRPVGPVSLEDLAYREVLAPDPASLKPGELLLRNRVFLCAPTIRNWMEPPGENLYPSIALGDPVMAPAACEVVASARADVPAGSKITTFTSWQDYQKVGADHPVSVLPADMSLTDAMGPYGINTRTAYFGLTKVGQPVAGETLVVSGAAGSTGSMAAQIGKILGLRVIGIAGGSDKCRWLVERCGLDAALDYRAGNLAAELAELCPKGIDIFYDNVGGPVLQAAIDNMARLGRIVLCGQIASYNANGPAQGPANMMRLIYGSVRMQGFLMGDYEDEFPEAMARLREWIESGRIIHREDIRKGFAGIPMVFNSVFEGSNSGTLLVELD